MTIALDLMKILLLLPLLKHHVTFSTSESCNKKKKEKIEIETGFADCNGKMKVDKCEIKIDSVH